MSSGDTQRFENKDLEPQPHKAPYRPAPSFAHFYILLALVLIAVGGAGYIFTLTYGQLADLSDTLGRSEVKAADSLSEVVDAMKGRLDGLDGTDAQLRADLARLRTELDTTRQQIVALESKLSGQITEVKKSVDDLSAAVETARGEFGSKLDTVKTELGQKHEQMAGKLTQLNDDSQYIISELGKKAEKAYLKFMERKLKKKINAVSEKVDTVKGDLEQQLASTQTRIEEVATDIGKTMTETIKKKVDEHVNIEFVPSTNDEE
jgi:chromosome segregation ATPase